MNAPYDGDRSQGTGDPANLPPAGSPPPAHQQPPADQQNADPYAPDPYAQGGQDPYAQYQQEHYAPPAADPYGQGAPGHYAHPAAPDPYAQQAPPAHPAAPDPYAQPGQPPQHGQPPPYGRPQPPQQGHPGQYAQPAPPGQPGHQGPHHGGRPAPDPYGHPGQDPYAQPADPYAADPYAAGPYAAGPQAPAPQAPHDPRSPYRQGDPRDPHYPQQPQHPRGGRPQHPDPRDPYGQAAAQAPGPPSPPYPQDPYLQDAYAPDPYQQRPDPLGDALYDHAAHPPPPPGSQPAAQPPYQQPPSPHYRPDPRLWANPPAPEPDGATRHLRYGDQTTQFVSIDDLVTGAGQQIQPEPDAFAHLFRDQRAPQPPPAGGGPQPAAPAPVPPQRTRGGRVASLARSSAVMAAGTLVSRITGFLRTLVISAALGVAVLGDTYTVAYTLPTMIYILTIGGGLNSVFVPQLVRAMKNDPDGGVAYANRLLTLVSVILGGMVLLAVFAAPVLIRAMSVKIADNPNSNEVAVTFAQYCLPTIFFMGIHVVMGQILNARGSFGPMMWTPVLNNVVIIATFGLFLWVYGTSDSSAMDASTIPPEGVRLLGVGTLLGLVVQALAMIPYLRKTGFRIRPRFDWKGHGLGKAAKLAKWTFLFVLANQAGMLVVTQLATWAGESASEVGHNGTGIMAFQNALLIWQMPQAIITVSVMAAMLPRISRAAADGDPTAVRDDISHGLRTSAVAIVPIAFALVALGIPMCTLLFAAVGSDAATSIGYVLMAFGLGLIPFSVQYVVLRGFYAYEDTRTPFYNTLIVAAVFAAGSAICFVMLADRHAVIGFAACYGIAYTVGVGVAWRRLKQRMGTNDLDGAHVVRTYARLVGACIPAALAGGGAAWFVTDKLGNGVTGSLGALLAGSAVLGAIFYVAARRMRIQELNAMMGMVRGRLGR
ncbi:murein biosynthesis integral membrane protein MurJ [Streptomyces sp. WMMC500]|uniref:murein biosynthesis integral membrane protein MurJ n=1 Tax=Streptomyces sp. WMMC500 TaxID=3015154 RepID=UPI00248B2626|nr:murein biosynthesis integral membrane protein MurJ [Streptomyces sp. WMMC500]WBB64554.1 murein biosynthesis integral membrane protein MurJ [Streptomyces sp. WMMC500]